MASYRIYYGDLSPRRTWRRPTIRWRLTSPALRAGAPCTRFGIDGGWSTGIRLTLASAVLNVRSLKSEA
jgi:hypothetical protein